MKRETVTATEAARSFSALLNRVRYNGQEFEIQRGREIIARLIPAGPTNELAVAQLNDLFDELPHLDEADAEAFARDIQMLRNQMCPRVDGWD